MGKRRFLFDYRFQWTMPDDAIEADDTDDAVWQAIELVMESLRDGGISDREIWEIDLATSDTEPEEIEDHEFACKGCDWIFVIEEHDRSADGLCNECAAKQESETYGQDGSD